MDAGGNLAEVIEGLIGLKSDDWVGGVRRFKADAFLVTAVSLHGKITVNTCDDDITACGAEGSVDNQEVSIVNPSLDHRIALNTDKVGGSRTLDEKFVQIKGRLEVLLGRRWKSSNYRSSDFCFGTHILGASA